MEYKLSFRVNEKIYLRDPESTALGKLIVQKAIDLIYELGFEQFTFKKLAIEIHSTEATIYRYFENKHRLLLYILNWYWCYMEYLILFQLQSVHHPADQLKTLVHLLTHEFPETPGEGFDYNKKYLNNIVISEGSKVYMVKEVNEINEAKVFKPYKDLCARIASVINAYNPAYKYPYSLASTLIETAHHQQFFSTYLPRLTDIQTEHENLQSEFASVFLEDLLFKTLA